MCSSPSHVANATAVELEVRRMLFAIGGDLRNWYRSIRGGGSSSRHDGHCSHAPVASYRESFAFLKRGRPLTGALLVIPVYFRISRWKVGVVCFFDTSLQTFFVMVTLELFFHFNEKNLIH